MGSTPSDTTPPPSARGAWRKRVSRPYPPQPSETSRGEADGRRAGEGTEGEGTRTVAPRAAGGTQPWGGAAAPGPRDYTCLPAAPGPRRGRRLTVLTPPSVARADHAHPSTRETELSVWVDPPATRGAWRGNRRRSQDPCLLDKYS